MSLQEWHNRGVAGYPTPTTLEDMSRASKAVQERAAQQQVTVGTGVGELAAAEAARYSKGAVQVTAAMMEASVSHAATA